MNLFLHTVYVKCFQVNNGPKTGPQGQNVVITKQYLYIQVGTVCLCLFPYFAVKEIHSFIIINLLGL